MSDEIANESELEQDKGSKSEIEDPLALKELALNYDYLIYKINDHVKNLSEQTFESVSYKDKVIKEHFLANTLDLDNELKKVDDLIAKCDEIELEFLKLDQLTIFIDDFKKRVTKLESQFQNRDLNS